MEEQKRSPDFFDWFDSLEYAMGVALNLQEAAIETATNAAKSYSEISSPINEPFQRTRSTIVFENKSVYLRNFADSERGTPVIILPPQAGHSSTIADFDPPSQSLIHTCLNVGITNLYSVDYKSATYDRKNESLDDLILSTLECVNQVVTRTGKKVILIGLCQGGQQVAIFTALYPNLVDGLIVAGSPIDTHADGGKIQLALNTYPFSFYESLVNLGGGLYRGEIQLFSFKMMNPMERFFIDYMDLYRNINDDEYITRYRKFRNQYEYTQNISGNLYLQIVKELFIENKLYNGGLIVLDEEVKLENIKCPVVLIAGKNDDITLINQVFNMAHKIGSNKVLNLTVPAGHIGIFMGKQSLKEFWPVALDFVVKNKK